MSVVTGTGVSAVSAVTPQHSTLPPIVVTHGARPVEMEVARPEMPEL